MYIFFICHFKLTQSLYIYLKKERNCKISIQIHPDTQALPFLYVCTLNQNTNQPNGQELRIERGQETCMNSSACLCAHTYTHVHAYTHTYVHACTHANIHVCTHRYVHACTHTYVHACTHTYMHALTNTTRMHSRTHTHGSTYI